MGDPARLPGLTGRMLTPGLRKGWDALSPERRAFLELLSRCALDESQALRLYDRTKRRDAGIEPSDAEFLANPYLLFESDRRSVDPVAFGAVDRGLFPNEAVRREFPIPEPSRIDDPADPRRVRALVADLLEEAARGGHTLLPQSWTIRRARERALQPPCPLGEGVLAATEPSFPPLIARIATGDGEAAYQLDRLAECRDLIRREVARATREGPTQPSTTGQAWSARDCESRSQTRPKNANWRSAPGWRRPRRWSSCTGRGSRS